MSLSGWDYEVTEILKVVDGDTFDLRIDLGFYMSAALRFRLLGVDTPEMNAKDLQEREKAKEAKEFVEKWLADALITGTLRVETYKSDSFGRWLAEPYRRRDGVEINLAADLLAAGLAVEYTR